MQNQNFQLVVDGVPYNVKAEPFSFNEGIRYKVTYNDSPELIFAWDDAAQQYMCIDNDAASVSSNVEMDIARELGRL